MTAHAFLYGKDATSSSGTLHASSRFSPRAVLLPVVLALSMARAHPGAAQTAPADSATADPTQEYVELKSGERVYGSLVLKKHPRSRQELFYVNDSLVYQQRVVRAYWADSIYRRRTDDDRWAQLVSDEGHLNLWQKTEWQSGMSFSISTSGSPEATQPTMGVPRLVKINYFSTEDGPVREVSYGNLKPVLQGHPESMQHLKQYNTMRTMQWVLAGVGATVFLGSAILASGDNGIPTGVYIGGAIALSSWIPHFARQGKLRQAIDTYNGAPAPSH